jgi:TRAP-type C4-dicarboxylate transport system permease small subunit
MMRALIFIASLLVVPLAILLFAQWPLRELVQAYSRLANDMAQVLFAVYVAVAVTAASGANTHLSAARPDGDTATSAVPMTGKLTRLRPWALLVCVGPWSVFMLWSAWPQIAASVTGLEKFGETLTPGFFLVKLALALMLVLVLVEALARVFKNRGDQKSRATP